MNFGICILSIVAVRDEPSEKSEMVSQLLFGELLEVIEKKNTWVKIRQLFDNYIGWIDEKQFLKLTDETFDKINGFPSNVTLDLVHVLENKSLDQLIPIVIGSSLPFLVKKTFYIEDHKYTYDGQIHDNKNKPERNDILENAMMYFNTPYLWGGRTPFGIDCSGFTQMVYKISGIKLLRDASQQITQGETINFISEAQAGDLVFFDNEEEEIIHVGILIGNNEIIHASGKVRIDRIDHDGIYNQNLKKYTHKLRLIKKIIP